MKPQNDINPTKLKNKGNSTIFTVLCFKIFLNFVFKFSLDLTDHREFAT